MTNPKFRQSREAQVSLNSQEGVEHLEAQPLLS